MRKVLVTGANGFIGRNVVDELSDHRQIQVVAVSRAVLAAVNQGVEYVRLTHLDGATCWFPALKGVSAVIHAAARVHMLGGSTEDANTSYRAVNVEGTLNLARQAAEAGVRRFVFISSIKVNGEGTIFGLPYHPNDPRSPTDPYGISKAQAEEGLIQLSRETGMEVVIIRPVLVYGPGVKANFRNMMEWLNTGIPLPFGALNNKRSLVSLDNLTDLIVTCLFHPAAANEIFLVSDGEDLSTTELLRRLGIALGKPVRLLPVPERLLRGSARLLGMEGLAQRLCGSLQVDISKTRELLDWYPRVSVDSALAKTAHHFLERHPK